MTGFFVVLLVIVGMFFIIQLLCGSRAQTENNSEPDHQANNSDVVFDRARRDRSLSPPVDRPLTIPQFLNLPAHRQNTPRASTSRENTPDPPILSRQATPLHNISTREATPLHNISTREATPLPEHNENILLHPLNPFRADTPPAILPVSSTDNDQSDLNDYGEMGNETGDIPLKNLSCLDSCSNKDFCITMV